MSHPHSRRPRWGLGGRVIAAGFLLGLVISSCEINDTESFNDAATELVCEIHAKCGEDVTTAIEIGMGRDLSVNCNGQVFDEFAACAGDCAFHEGRARRCIRRLERMSNDCDVGSLGPCRRVYTDCQNESSEGSCDLWNCTVGERGWSGGVLALGVLALGWRRRRRSTSIG